MARNRGKRYRAAIDEVDRTTSYPPAEAVSLIKQTAGTKFDETVEVHMRLASTSATPRSSCAARSRFRTASARRSRLPCSPRAMPPRRHRGRGDFVGAADLAERVEQGWTDFDTAIAIPALMGPVVSKLGRILGPQGKMPNPKVGTVTDDVGKAVSEAKAGKVEYRTDRSGIVHLTIGKASFPVRDLLENYAAIVDEIVRAKPAAAKGRYLLSITLATTMGPGVRVDTARTRESEILAGCRSSRRAATGPRPSPPSNLLRLSAAKNLFLADRAARVAILGPCDP